MKKKCAEVYATTLTHFLWAVPVRIILFPGSLTVAAHELIDATGGVDELALTSIERVRSA
jgi:hypothetical protein